MLPCASLWRSGALLRHKLMPPRRPPQVRYNLTKTVRKRPIDEAGAVLGEWYIDRSAELKHEARGRARGARGAPLPPQP